MSNEWRHPAAPGSSLVGHQSGYQSSRRKPTGARRASCGSWRPDVLGTGLHPLLRSPPSTTKQTPSDRVGALRLGGI